jgi:hypothetical protein
VPYPLYFGDQFPFGKIEQDIGYYINDFSYGIFENSKYPLGMDWGTARAYKIKFDIDGGLQDGIVLSHETGLEMFLIAAGTFVGVESSKFLLKRTLETIEKSINIWWEKRKKNYWRGDNSKDPLVLAIQVRTPKWEITIDGKFTNEEKEKLFNFIQTQLEPGGEIKDLLRLIHEKELAKKIKNATKKIVKQT